MKPFVPRDAVDRDLLWYFAEADGQLGATSNFGAMVGLAEHGVTTGDQSNQTTEASLSAESPAARQARIRKTLEGLDADDRCILRVFYTGAGRPDVLRLADVAKLLDWSPDEQENERGAEDSLNVAKADYMAERQKNPPPRRPRARPLPPVGTKATGYITLEQAADALGMTGPNRERRLRRQLEGREKATGQTILARSGEGRGTRYQVTLASLRAHCPELFFKGDELAERVAARLSELEQQIQRLASRQEATSKALRDLRKHVFRSAA